MEIGKSRKSENVGNLKRGKSEKLVNQKKVGNEKRKLENLGH